MRAHACPNCGNPELTVSRQDVPEGHTEDPLTTNPPHELIRLECHQCGWSGTVGQRAIH